MSALTAIGNAASRFAEAAQTAIGIAPSHAKSIHKDIRITQILIHPIKSCRGTSVAESSFDPGGLRYDRSWLIIDATSKKFQTARELPHMVTIVPRMDLTNNELSIEIPLREKGKGIIVVKTPLDPSEEEVGKMELVQGIEIWGSITDGYAVSKEADEALSVFFGKQVRLVRKGPAVRASGPDDPRGDDSQMHFQDFYPILLASTASLQHVRDTLLASVYPGMSDKDGNMPVKDKEEMVNKERQVQTSAPPGSWAESAEETQEDDEDAKRTPVVSYKVPNSLRRDYWTPEQLESFEIRRFRPNILVESYNEQNNSEKALVPWEEDAWTHIEIFDGKKEASGEIKGISYGSQALSKGTGIDIVARCARCMVPSIDPESGYRDPHLPYLVLQKFRVVQPEFKSLAKPCFGMLSSPSQKSGTLRVGDIVRVTSTTDPSKRTMRK